MVRATLPIAFCLLFLAPLAVFAQRIGDQDAFVLQVDETIPAPGKEVTVHIRSGDLQVSSIRSVRWFVDGREREEFGNKLSIKEVVGNRIKNVSARITYFTRSGDRRYINADTEIHPVIFDLLWEGDSVVTPLYRGYPLAGPQVPIRVYAEIQYIDRGGITYTEDDFSFVWEVETGFHPDTGPGVSDIVYEEGGTLINNSVFVLARATLINDNRVRYEKAIHIPIVETRLIVYPHTVTRGLITERAVPESVLIRQQPLTVALYPFYFSREDFENPGTVSYQWFVNGERTASREGRKVDVSLDGEGVTIPIQVLVRNSEKKEQESVMTLDFTI